MYMLYILRLELLLAKADFYKTKKIPNQRDRSRFLHGESNLLCFPHLEPAALLPVGQKDLCCFLAVPKDCI